MREITGPEAIEDHILMAHTYAKTMGDPLALAEAEATISERRGQTDPEYARDVRVRVSQTFTLGGCRDRGELVRAARTLETNLWADYREREKGRLP